MSKEYFIPRITKQKLDTVISVLNGDGSGVEVLGNGVYHSVKDSEYHGLKKGDEYEFVEERAGGVILSLKK